MNIQNKTIIVTGVGNGIGRELTLNLVKRKVKVIGLDINLDYLRETKKLAGENEANVDIYALDISDKTAIENLVAELKNKQINIDGIINNAGIIQPFIKINNLDYNTIDKVMRVNFFGPIYLIKSLLPELLTKPEACIVNISSMGGFLPVPGQSVYGASKAALKLLTEGLYAELINTNVKVSIVFPGAIATNIVANSLFQGKSSSNNNKKTKYKALPADQAANIIIEGMIKNKFQIFVGQDSKFMNFIYRLNPKFAVKYISKQMQNLLSD